MYGVHFLMQSLYRLRHDGTAQIHRTIGERGTVYVPIPPNHEGLGKIQIRTQGRIMEYAAQTSGPDRLKTGTTVEVVEIVSPMTVEVEPVDAMVPAERDRVDHDRRGRRHCVIVGRAPDCGTRPRCKASPKGNNPEIAVRDCSADSTHVNLIRRETHASPTLLATGLPAGPLGWLDGHRRLRGGAVHRHAVGAGQAVQALPEQPDSGDLGPRQASGPGDQDDPCRRAVRDAACWRTMPI